jgi:hypothetical protein
MKLSEIANDLEQRRIAILNSFIAEYFYVERNCCQKYTNF